MDHISEMDFEDTAAVLNRIIARSSDKEAAINELTVAFGDILVTTAASEGMEINTGRLVASFSYGLVVSKETD